MDNTLCKSNNFNIRERGGWLAYLSPAALGIIVRDTRPHPDQRSPLSSGTRVGLAREECDTGGVIKAVAELVDKDGLAVTGAEQGDVVPHAVGAAPVGCVGGHVVGPLPGLDWDFAVR